MFIGPTETSENLLFGNLAAELGGKIFAIQFEAALDKLLRRFEAGPEILQRGSVVFQRAQTQQQQLGDFGSQIKILHAIDGEHEERLFMVLKVVADFLGERFFNGANVLQHPLGLGTERFTEQRGQGEAKVRLAGAVAGDGEGKGIFPGGPLCERAKHIPSKRRGIGQPMIAGSI